MDNRGNALFPPLAYAHGLTGDERYLRIGMLALTAAGLNQFYFDPLMVMRGYLLGDAKRVGAGVKAEKQYQSRAQELLFANATDGIPNAGFEGGAAGWSARRPFEIDAKKRCEGRQSLRIPVSDKVRAASVAPCPIRMAARLVYTFSGYVTHEGRALPGVVLSYRDFSGLRSKIGARYAAPIPNSFYSTQIAPAAGNTPWRRWSIRVETEEGGIASLRLDARQDVRGAGAVWYDAIRVEEKPR